MPDKITKFIQSINKKTREKLKRKLQDLRRNTFAEASDVKK